MCHNYHIFRLKSTKTLKAFVKALRFRYYGFNQALNTSTFVLPYHSYSPIIVKVSIKQAYTLKLRTLSPFENVRNKSRSICNSLMLTIYIELDYIYYYYYNLRYEYNLVSEIGKVCIISNRFTYTVCQVPSLESKVRKQKWVASWGGSILRVKRNRNALVAGIRDEENFFGLFSVFPCA